MRNELFGISGIRGNYPQFFFELEDGTLNFFGNFQKIEELNETNDIQRNYWNNIPRLRHGIKCLETAHSSNLNNQFSLNQLEYNEKLISFSKHRASSLQPFFGD